MTYEYECQDCKSICEVEQSINAPTLTLCPCCFKHSLKRLISGGTGFLLKGSGWANDLYSKKSVTSKKENSTNE